MGTSDSVTPTFKGAMTTPFESYVPSDWGGGYCTIRLILSDNDDEAELSHVAMASVKDGYPTVQIMEPIDGIRFRVPFRPSRFMVTVRAPCKHVGWSLHMRFEDP